MWIVTSELSEHPDEVNSKRMGIVFVVVRSVCVAVTETFLWVAVTVVVPCRDRNRTVVVTVVVVVTVPVTIVCFDGCCEHSGASQ